MKKIKGDADIVFGYGTSRENPADITFHGTKFKNFTGNDMRWFWPTWLIEAEKKWPSILEELNEKAENDARSELKKTALLQPTECD